MIFEKIKWALIRFFNVCKSSWPLKPFNYFLIAIIATRNFFNWKWLEDPLPKVMLNLFAGALFALWWEDRMSAGTVNFKYEKPTVTIKLNKNKDLAPTEVDYTVPIVVQNKTNTSFDINAFFRFRLTPLEQNTLSRIYSDDEVKKMGEKEKAKIWRLSITGNAPGFKVDDDGYGKLAAHDYFKGNEIIIIYPPEKMLAKDFNAFIDSCPEEMIMESHQSIKFPKDESVDEEKTFKFKKVIQIKWNELTIPGYQDFEEIN